MSDSGRDARGALTRVGNHSKRLEIGEPAHVPIPTSQWLNRRHLRFASVRVYIAAVDLKFWKKALREAERELDAGTTRTALGAAAKKLMRAKAGLKRLQVETLP